MFAECLPRVEEPFGVLLSWGGSLSQRGAWWHSRQKIPRPETLGSDPFCLPPRRMPSFSLLPALCPVPPASASGLPNRNCIAARYCENKNVHCYHYWFLSSKPEVKNTLFEECDGGWGDSWKERRETKRMKYNHAMLPEGNNWGKPFQYKELISTLYSGTWNLSSKIIYYNNVSKIAAHRENITARYC